MYKLLLFYHSSDSVMEKYTEYLINSISYMFPDVTFEKSDQTDIRWELHANLSNRFPAYVLFKNDVKKNMLLGKYDANALSRWLAFNIS